MNRITDGHCSASAGSLTRTTPSRACRHPRSGLRRGWFWGARSFEEWLRGKVREGGSKPEGHALRMSAESRACHDEEEAEQIVAGGMKCLHLKEAELKTTVGSDPRKVAIAQAVHEKTAAAGKGTAARLEMKSAMNVSQQIKRLRTGENKLSTEVKQWLQESSPGTLSCVIQSRLAGKPTLGLHTHLSSHGTRLFLPDRLFRLRAGHHDLGFELRALCHGRV